MKDWKLRIGLLPKGAWGNDFSRTFSKNNWDIIRNKCYEKANGICQICGSKTDDLDAHEVWSFDVESKTQTLKDIIGICSSCHGVIHFHNSNRLGYGENAKRHFMRVNNATELEFASHLTKAIMVYEERNKVYRWKMIADLSKFGLDNSEIKEIKLPMIINPYDNLNFGLSNQSVSLSPSLIDLVVDNYTGIIKVKCDKTNKIEWFSDNNLINSKFNFGRKFITKFSVKDLSIKSLYCTLS